MLRLLGVTADAKESSIGFFCKQTNNSDFYLCRFRHPSKLKCLTVLPFFLLKAKSRATAPRIEKHVKFTLRQTAWSSAPASTHCFLFSEEHSSMMHRDTKM